MCHRKVIEAVNRCYTTTQSPGVSDPPTAHGQGGPPGDGHNAGRGGPPPPDHVVRGNAHTAAAVYILMPTRP